jgi:hypothetical protein
VVHTHSDSYLLTCRSVDHAGGPPAAQTVARLPSAKPDVAAPSRCKERWHVCAVEQQQRTWQPQPPESTPLACRFRPSRLPPLLSHPAPSTTPSPCARSGLGQPAWRFLTASCACPWRPPRAPARLAWLCWHSWRHSASPRRVPPAQACSSGPKVTGSGGYEFYSIHRPRLLLTCAHPSSRERKETGQILVKAACTGRGSACACADGHRLVSESIVCRDC